MKKIVVFLLISATSLLAKTYEDGVYRGVFVSGQETQVEVQFDLKNDVVQKAKYRTLFFKGKDFLKSDELTGIKSQYDALLDYIIGKNVNKGMKAFYNPEKIERAGATIRATKVRAAIKNALNTDVYKPIKNR